MIETDRGPLLSPVMPNLVQPGDKLRRIIVDRHFKQVRISGQRSRVE